jgi:predicted amidohydrolase YtcJ
MLFPAVLAAQTADLVVTHARIYTVDTAHPAATAIAVKGARILYVGTDAAGFIGPKTKVIDAQGAAVIPGLFDSHVHMQALGDSLETLDLRGMQSEAAIAAKVKDAAGARRPGEWIRGRAWDQNLFADRQFPTQQSLSKAAPGNPVFLERVDGHAAWVNQKALDMADVNRATADPAGGKILRDPAGRPTGVLIDRAQALVRAKVPAASLAEVERRLERAAGECARLGMTSVADAGIGATELAAYRELIAQHRLPVRIYAMLSVSMNETALWRSYQAKGPQVSDFLTVRSLKLYADGALGSRGAALLDPYTDDPHNTGILISSEDFIRTTAQEAAKAGFQVNTHAIGDRAVHIVLNAYAAALNGPNDRRFRIEHAQIVAPGDFARFKRYAVIASMQPTHATSDMPWAEQRLGPRRILGAYAWQTMWKAGVPVASGSDFPVENPNPLWGFYSAVTRQDHEGNPPAGWYPAQRMSRDEALRSWTYEGAYAAFQENDKGTLEAGKLADFVMLSDDIMQSPARQIWEARVRLTVLGGEIVFHQP